MNFPHLGLKVPKLKFGSFFQNSYRSNDLTNSKRSDPNFLYKKLREVSGLKGMKFLVIPPGYWSDYAGGGG